MSQANETVDRIAAAGSWDDRVARIRQVPQRHGTDEHAPIFAEVARQLYVPHLAPDFAYVHQSAFYELPHFQAAYDVAHAETVGFIRVGADELDAVLRSNPLTLLVFRTIIGLTRTEFAAATVIVAEPLGLESLSASKVDAMERLGRVPTPVQARVTALTIDAVMEGSLFGVPPGELKSKLTKPDTANGWSSVQRVAAEGVPYGTFLNQRHYGGAFRQVLDATSTRRGDLIEDAVENLFLANGVPFIRTSANNQGEIERRFEVAVRPAPDFVVFDGAGALRGLLECKGANDGGTARDKALRFARLALESVRLGGVPLLAVLGGLGWTRVNDTLGPVVRDCDGRVFTLATLPEMMSVHPFPTLTGLAGSPEPVTPSP